jgi:hypothetical protein
MLSTNMGSGTMVSWRPRGGASSRVRGGRVLPGGRSFGRWMVSDPTPGLTGGRLPPGEPEPPGDLEGPGAGGRGLA